MSLDQKILARLESGDASVLSDIMQMYVRELGAIAVGITGSRDLGEDVLQDVLVKLWDNRKSLGHINDLRQYMRRLVRNHALNLHKHEQYQTGLGDRVFHDAPGLPSVAQNDAQQKLSYEDVHKILLSALANVPPRCREIFLLSWEGGLSHPEIAHDLGITPATVHNQIHRARQAIAGYLKGVNPGFEGEKG